MLHDLRTQLVIGDMLVVPPGDQDDLLRERTQPRDGAAGAGCDGVVIVAHAVQLPHQLDAVLHPAEGAGEVPDHLVGHQVLHHGNGRHVVLQIVQARN